MKVREVDPNVDPGALLPGAQFIDAYRIAVEHAALDARQAAERMLARAALDRCPADPAHLIVAPFGLKTSAPNQSGTADIIGLFPVLSQTPDRLVAGFDDKHLDFRIVVDVAGSGASRNVTATTLVLTHNLLGRVYLATILPFHRLVVRAMLRQVAT
jgi:hypothetical protein